MSVQQDAGPQLFDAFLKAAQYIVRLKSQQDVWEHLAKLIITQFPAAWVAFARRDCVRQISIHYSTLPGGAADRQILSAEVCTVIAEVLDSGFLASHVVAAPGPSMTALLPIVEEYETKEVMLIGHHRAEPLPKQLLDVYLAVAGLAGTACERLDNERELNRHRAHLEDLVRERTAELALALGEKEVLLKEIHHRVKNNMQVISSLVALQADRLPDGEMRAVLQDVTHRVRSMALVHEKLYQSADMARVEFAQYAESLLNYLWRAYGAAALGIRLALELEPVSLSVNVAVPCGLILNELASNALKHAFPRKDMETRGCGDGQRAGDAYQVKVALSAGPEGRVCLRVCDNGRGLPPGLDWRQADSLGLRLVQMLAGQLHAAVEVHAENGTAFSVTFGGK